MLPIKITAARFDNLYSPKNIDLFYIAVIYNRSLILFVYKIMLNSMIIL